MFGFMCSIMFVVLELTTRQGRLRCPVSGREWLQCLRKLKAEIGLKTEAYIAPQPTDDVTIVTRVLFGFNLGSGMLLMRTDWCGLPLCDGRFLNTLILLPRIAVV